MNRWPAALAAIVVITAIAAIAPAVERSVSRVPEEVSIIQLLARPKEFHGKLVLVKGFLDLRFENRSLYPSEAHALGYDVQSGIGVSSFSAADEERCNRRYVSMIAVVEALDRDTGMRPPIVLVVKSVEPLEKRDLGGGQE